MPDDKNRAGGIRLSPFTVLLILVLFAMSTRLLPMSISQYPFNNDGITECRIANDLLASRKFDLPDDAFYQGTHSIITPAYNVLLAFVSSLTGQPTWDLAQVIIAVFSVITIVGIYLVTYQMTDSRKGALTASMVLGLLGTFVFLTGSTWKGALGVSMLVLLLYAYINRGDRRMFVLEVLVLVTLPFVHHLVTVVAYFSVAYLTIWSIVFAISRNSGIKRRHIIDLAVIGFPSIFAYLYYYVYSLDRLDFISSEAGFLAMGLSFVALVIVTVFLLGRRTHSKYSFAPVPASAILALFIFDYYNPLFPYSPSSPEFILLLGAAASVIVAIAWYGFEIIIESSQTYRAVPVVMLISVITIWVFALLSGFGLDSHQILYRTFDYADISLALGVAIAVAHLAKRPRAERLVIIATMCALLVSFPFGYATGFLTGVRHDTQGYEMDALSWADASIGSDRILQSDERLAYDARALYDFQKKPDLPYSLVNEEPPGTSMFNLFEEEWTTAGVNNYPWGHPVIDADYVEWLMESSDVLYVGGPSENNAIIFSTSSLGMGSF
jgi:hypothetical protein